MLYLIIGSALAFILFIALQPMVQRRRRERVARRPFDPAWNDLLERNWPLYRRIPPALKEDLQRHIQLFLAEKRFFGCQDLELTTEIKLFIAAQAALVIVAKPFSHYDKLRSILVYPSAFITNRMVSDADRIHSVDGRVLAGEAWHDGKIIIAWDEAFHGMIDSKDGANVVVHEFAHLLDHENGSANGAPYLEPGQDYATWSRVLGTAFDRLNKELDAQTATMFSSYAASNPAEFFAVASEVFFEQGAVFRAHSPELYEQFAQYYLVDPAEWPTGA